MKNKFKITEKFLKEHGITDLDINDDMVVKRLSLTSDSEVMLDEMDDMSAKGKISTVDVDSDGDIVLMEGIDTSRFSKNPVILFQHDMNKPIGKMTKLDNNGDHMEGTVKFSTEPFSQKIHQLMKDGVLRTFSIGFIPTETAIKGTQDFNKSMGELESRFPGRFDKSKVNRVIKKSLLLETSVVTIPANENAVISEVKALKLDETPEVIEEKSVDEQIAEIIETPEVIEKEIEVHKIVIKKVGKISTITKVSSLDNEKLKLQKQLYLQNWGI
jgi:HK97 family phage prohead protease